MDTKSKKNKSAILVFCTIVLCVMVVSNAIYHLVTSEVGPNAIYYDNYYTSNDFRSSLSDYFSKNYLNRGETLYFYSHEITVSGSQIILHLEEKQPQYQTLNKTVALPTSLFKLEKAEWENGRQKFMYHLYIGGTIGIVTLVLLLVMFFVVKGERSPFFDPLDKLYTEGHIAGIAALVTLWFCASDQLFSGFPDPLSMNNALYVAGNGFIACLVGVLIVSLIRKIKKQIFFKSFLIFQVGQWLFSPLVLLKNKIFEVLAFKNDVISKRMLKRSLVFIGASFGCVLGFFSLLLYFHSPLSFVFILLELIFIYHYLMQNMKILKNVDAELLEVVEEKMKSERMKVELITNMSHDLKTPLTSIITYSDLLSKEPLDQTANDYVNILKMKTTQLSKIVSDLFDLSKSASGNLTISPETLDLKKLLEQTVGSFQEEIEASTLKFVVTTPETPVSITTDGTRLYRVFQNLIDNIFKYSMPNTRVYITLERTEGLARIVFKNISSSELTLNADEMLQRFSRGDVSRSSEGSGLGLSIAKSFAEACGGNFYLTIDGDLFKAEILFKIPPKKTDNL